MHGPPLVGWALAALCGVVTALHVLRTRTGAVSARNGAAGESLMGLGMTVMALPPALLPRPWAPAALAVLFAGAAVHGLLLARSDIRHLHHVLGCLAMLHLTLPLAAAGGESGHMPGMTHGAGTGTPLLTGLLLTYYAGYVLWAGARLAPRSAATAHAGAAARAPHGVPSGEPPELAPACRLSMGIGMFAMLLTM